ncbi:hypothetical protein [Pseudomonas sp. FEN]|uniref:hypothetical protein n=1 Tax=Pseudomonas sp. FEN TaxID=2767468 RepID=UPI001999CF1F|nr:hypothetical protein [Pseudomonas sp. FEN]CAD5200894.1 YheO-like PAS domain [Pseudomonas sp. FEN]
MILEVLTDIKAVNNAFWREKLNDIVEAISVRQCVRRSDFGRGEIRLALIGAKAGGLLDVRNFVDYFAEYFEISRATLYNYLKAIAADDGNG